MTSIKVHIFWEGHIFCEVSTVDFFYVVTVKSKVEILQNVVAFSEYMNFMGSLAAISSETYGQYLEYLVSTTLSPIYFTGFERRTWYLIFLVIVVVILAMFAF